MGKLKYTPGPWEWYIIDHSAAILHAGDIFYKSIMTTSPCQSCYKKAKEWEWGRCTTPNEANARLIAAAPEMLEFLINIIKYPDDLIREEFSINIVSIIEKATGMKIEDII